MYQCLWPSQLHVFQTSWGSPAAGDGGKKRFENGGDYACVYLHTRTYIQICVHIHIYIYTHWITGYSMLQLYLKLAHLTVVMTIISKSDLEVSWIPSGPSVWTCLNHGPCAFCSWMDAAKPHPEELSCAFSRLPGSNWTCFCQIGSINISNSWARKTAAICFTFHPGRTLI